MKDNDKIIYESVVRGMKEGVFTLDRTGHITSMNPAAMTILRRDESAVGNTFAAEFFGDEENDEFCETVLTAVYHNDADHNGIVRYRAGEEIRQLYVRTSYLRNGEETIGIAAVINDVTELYGLRDAVKAMEKIRALNEELEKRNAFIKKTFGRYLSDEIVAELLDTKDGLEIGGKKQRVAVMFSDLRGFTALSEAMEPTALIGMLNGYLEKMIEIVMAHRGTILEFIGDAIVAVFGAPLDSDTRETDAVSCAIAMQNAMEEVNAENTARSLPALEMGIGIHTGEVVLGNIGSLKKSKYDVIGSTVNLASRIETYTVGGQILISEAVKDAVGPALVTAKTVEAMPKGVREPITLYEVAALGDLSLASDHSPLLSLNPPVKVKCRPMEGKHRGSDEYPGSVTAASRDEFLLSVPLPLSFGDSVTVSVEENDLCAKVTGEKDGLYLMHVTSGSAKNLWNHR